MIQTKADPRVERVPAMTHPISKPQISSPAATLEGRLAYLLSAPDDKLADANPVRAAMFRELPALLTAAFKDEDPAALLDIHKTLYGIYEISFANPLSPACLHEGSTWLAELRSQLESAWLDFEVTKVASRLPEPDEIKTPEAIVSWFEEHAKHQTELDRKVVQFLAVGATREQFETFVLSDAQLNYRFYDALVLAQLHYAEIVKAEISHHMWDECGCGDIEQAHTKQFTRSLERLGLSMPAIPIWEDWRPYAGHNLYFCFGLSRRHYFKALGSLAMPELFDPERDRAVNVGLERLGFVAKTDFEYFFNHVEGDEEHGPSWVEHVIAPIVQLQPEAAFELAVGGAMRMEAMRRYNAYLAKRFGLTSPES